MTYAYVMIKIILIAVVALAICLPCSASLKDALPPNTTLLIPSVGKTAKVVFVLPNGLILVEYTGEINVAYKEKKRFKKRRAVHHWTEIKVWPLLPQNEA